jgi:hypothetical protein
MIKKIHGHVYECIKSMKPRIEKDPATPVSILYEQEVKKFRRENGTARLVPEFDRVRSCLHNSRSLKHPTLPKSLSTIEVPHPLTRTLFND